MSEYKVEIVWRNVIYMTLFHLGAFYGIKCMITDSLFKTIFFAVIMTLLSSMGIMVGAHRLWSHRAFKAKLPLQVILAFLQSMAFQSHIYEWSRDHRAHHKYCETDADPNNSNRGFLFAHIGWLLIKKHPDVKQLAKILDLSDLEHNPIIRFQRRFYFPIALISGAVIPTFIPYYFWSENLSSSFFICVMFRTVLVFHLTWLVSSAAHMWGTKPYNKNINSVECVLKNLVGGEGYHNYHHSFPWDYSCSEHGPSDVVNPATSFIDIFAEIGWAYDLRKVPKDMVEEKMRSTGDQSVTKPLNSKEYALGVLASYSHYLFFIFVKISYNVYQGYFENKVSFQSI